MPYYRIKFYPPPLQEHAQHHSVTQPVPDIPDIEAVIEFIDKEEWRVELTRLIEEANDKTVVDTAEIAGELPEHISPAHQAREKLLGVYPHLRTTDGAWNVEQLLADPEINEYLAAGSLPFSASTSGNFQKTIEKFIASAMSTSRAFWPLVKRVSLMGRFDVLSTGITLVDLPGHGDVDSARDTMANKYLQHADLICLVSDVQRAKDDSDIQSRLYKTLHQIIQDGRVHEKSIALILTRADAKIGTNEVTLDPDEQRKVDRLAQECRDLAAEIEAIKVKKNKKGKSRSSKRESIMEALQTQIYQREEQKNYKNMERSRIQATGRNEIVKAALQDKYQQLYRDLMTKNEDEKVTVPEVPIFCLGSRDYLCLAHLEPDNPSTFSDPEDTDIPRMKRYLLNDGERRNLVEAISVVGNFCTLLSQTTSQLDANATGDAGAHQKISKLLAELDKKSDELSSDTMDKIRDSYRKIGTTLNEAVGEARDRSPSVFEDTAKKMKWNQYRAMMRSNGAYAAHPPGNLNADLVATIQPRVGTTWAVEVNGEIPLHLLNLYNELKGEYDDVIKEICWTFNKYTTSRVNKTVGFETIIDQLNQDNRSAAMGAQRQGIRVWDTEVTERLKPQFARVCAEKGPGMFKRMKACNKTFIENPIHRTRLFSDILPKVNKSFDQCFETINGNIATALEQLRCNIRTAYFGSKPVVAQNPQQQAEAAAKTFGQDHEEAMISTLDELKTRLQQLS
ncbi:hypothetical protein FB45DRAFT_1037701 [Roridomyces roridus]|uniref:Uncharacterized protein n=1 Tax=Roridomyces roridus TaxID=1738132 RepID=A0AAD7F9K4_9AGAR|nr:hypothetical protein FB45DRAFT_1037701 [Roridomyces roridus]